MVAVNIPFYWRIVRATVLAVKQTEYVERAPGIGAAPRRDVPGIASFLTVLGFNLLVDGVSDVLEPRLR